MFSSLIYESGEGLDPEEEKLYKQRQSKTLSENGMRHNSILCIDDQSQTLKLKLTLASCTILIDPHFFEIEGEVPEAQKLKEEVQPHEEEEEFVEVIEKPEKEDVNKPVKRKANSDPKDVKKAKGDVY